MTSRLLLAEPSTTMRFVLDNYVQSLGHTVVSLGDYHEAVEALRTQFQSFDNDFDAVIVGWPSVAVREADTLTALLERDDFHALPVLVMSTDQRAETRAWVADRPNSAMLAWKSYEAVEATLASLVKSKSVSSNGADDTAVSVKFDNSDTGLLLIDDSPSIRESLTNVLTIHGYRIHATADRNEALAVLAEHSIDVAIVDFYLQDETGDEVCRALLQAEPSIVCAILTSAYSDPIIKLSLRAGAVDCMFKNEAGELLLARIDALARLVRQRKALKTEQQRLDRLVDTLAGATLLLNDSNQITYISQQAADQLGYVERGALVGQPAARILDPTHLQVAGNGRHAAQWVNANQETIDVLVRQIPLNGTSERMLNFKSVLPNGAQDADYSEPQDEQLASASAADAGAFAEPAIQRPQRVLLQFSETAQGFVNQLDNYIERDNQSEEPVSVLVLGINFQFIDDSLFPVSEDKSLDDAVNESIFAIYSRENHVARLSGHQFGILLRHQDAPQSYLLTRKIMQLCNDTALPESYEGKGKLCVTGCLLSLGKNLNTSAEDLLERGLNGLKAVDVRGVNQALLLDLKRMLTVYPE